VAFKQERVVSFYVEFRFYGFFVIAYAGGFRAFDDAFDGFGSFTSDFSITE
jgi:hypothetical protein